MANLKLQSVNKIYPSGALALYDINLELNDKQFVAVVGGEKSGKTSLLRLIAGLEEVTEGQIFIGEKDVTKVDPKDRDIAMIFRNNTLYPALNVFDNMAFGLRLRKTPNSVVEQRVKAAAEILGLSDVLFRKPKTLTTEQKQKVVFGRAIVREPKLYLFDDPLSGLDDGLKANMRNVIVNLQARMEGTFIYATKNINEALSMATQVIVLRDGFVQQIDTPANLYDYPANAYVAFLIGSPSINFINKAGIQKRDEGYFATFAGGEVKLADSTVARFANIDEYADSDKKVILGIRAEDLSLADEGNFDCTVAKAEEINGAKYIECDLTSTISFVLQGDAVKGDKVKVSADLTKLYIFDEVSRYNVLTRDEGYVKTDASTNFKPLPYDEEEGIKTKLTTPVTKPKKK